MIKTKIEYYEVADIRDENDEPTCYAVHMNNIRIGYTTLFPDGWHIEQEENGTYKTLKVCKTLKSAKKEAENLLTADMIKIRKCHRLTVKEIREYKTKYNLNTERDLIHLLVGFYGYIDNDDLNTIAEILEDE